MTTVANNMTRTNLQIPALADIAEVVIDEYCKLHDDSCAQYDAKNGIDHSQHGNLHQKIGDRYLHKLLFLCQGYALGWSDGLALTNADFVVNSGGVHCSDLEALQNGDFLLSRGDLGGDPSRVSDWHRDVVASVMKSYGFMYSGTLTEITGNIRIVREARTEGSGTIITKDAMQDWFKRAIDVGLM